MAYLTTAEAKERIGIASADTSEDSYLSSLITAAQAAIDTHCGRSFEAATATRYYNADSVRGDLLVLDEDLRSVTTLTNGDEVVIPSSGYWLWPRNAAPPYWGIKLKSTYIWSFSVDGMISVAGSWGYSATAPAPIVQAMRAYVSFLYHGEDRAKTGLAKGADAFTVSQELPEHIAVLLSPYRRRST